MRKDRKHIAKSNMMICASCGATFEELRPACPYCGTASIKGAEAEYMARLGDVREDLAKLKNVPMEETKQVLKKQGRLAILVIVIACVVILGIALMGHLLSRTGTQNRPEDYAWQLENFPLLDEMYANEQWEELVDFYDKVREEDKPISHWEHWWFTFRLSGFMYGEEILDKEARGVELVYDTYVLLLYYELCAKYLHLDGGFTEEELQYLEPYTHRLLTDLDGRWKFTEKEKQAIEQNITENYGSVSFDLCEKYVKKWMKEEKK
ncbi:MAG: hypothetical protein IJ327_01935 [Lachnospiraceae bacterium]|nr:hypothetical protein [Lachnospiraceae bacterium]